MMVPSCSIVAVAVICRNTAPNVLFAATTRSGIIVATQDATTIMNSAVPVDRYGWDTPDLGNKESGALPMASYRLPSSH